MIEFSSQTSFALSNPKKTSDWIEKVVVKNGFKVGDISYVFCDDEQLLKINQEFLDHDTYTDIITFDYSMGKTLIAEIMISVDRVTENAKKYGQSFERECSRVMIHGVLHCMGMKDGDEEAAQKMRIAEDEALQLIE
ncbi:MAG: rRNA maturation RNase YbeY [Gilvibacter sp.]